jgi:YVTN family beta-propeller protein
VLLAAVALVASAAAQEMVGSDTGLTSNGRRLDPAGRLTALGAFPTGGALTPDGRFYWAVDAGRGNNFVRVISVSSGAVVQTLPLPGGYVGIAFAPNGRRAYVSGQPAEGKQPPEAKGKDGDVIHVYEVDTENGHANELDPIALSGTADGAAAGDELPPASGVNAWPEGMDVTRDGAYLVVALGQADQVAIVNLKTKAVSLADVGRYPYGVVTDPRRSRAYVTNERDGTVSVLDLPSGDAVATIPVGGERGDYAHPEGITADPERDRVYVAVTDRDTVAVIDAAGLKVERYVEVSRKEAAIGSAPVSLAVAPNGDTLYVANAGEDAVVAIALERRPTVPPKPRKAVVPRSAASIGTYLRKIAKARRVRKGYRARAAALRKRYLKGRRVKSCGGPTTTQDNVYSRAVLKAYAKRAAARRRGVPKAAAQAAFKRSVAKARAKLPVIVDCPRAGFEPGAKAFSILGRIPTAAYTTDVEVSPGGGKLVWLAAKGLGTGPNPHDESIKELTRGRFGVLDRPTDHGLDALTARVARAVVPTNFKAPPANTPILGPGGGPSEQIKYVFYVVKENRTYDQIFGSEPRGNGEPKFELFDDNGVPGPTGGVTPNVHALARKFPLLDNVYANSEESTVGHKITTGGYANDYTQRFVHTNRGRKGNPDIFPIGIPPNAFVFDQAVRQGLDFRVYGELGAGNQPFGDDGRPTYQGVLQHTDPAYPSQVQGTCTPFSQSAPGPNTTRCTADAGEVGTTAGPPNHQSRIRVFQPQFLQQVAAGTVPAFNYLILFNNHTNGTTPGVYTPKTDVADNDLAVGQLVELVSQSSIWSQSAIFVLEDDSQDGIDHADAHRIPALVISPWARRGAIVSTRYDQYSFLRTAEMIVGLKPLSINDALATPLYDAFVSGGEGPDVEGTRFHAIQPEQSMTEVNPSTAANARLSAALPWNKVDTVPQRLSDRILWQSVFGPDSTPPPPGPNASPVERARATGALKVFRAGGSVRRWLVEHGEDEDE